MRIRPILLPLLLLSVPVLTHAERKAFSTAGYFTDAGTPRETFDFNVGWRFKFGDVKDGGAENVDDSGWKLVSAPHGVDEALPEEASGCINRQGPAWYRKKFTAPASFAGKRVTLRFEGILGKSEIWLNGRLLRRHFSGFLPAVVDITDSVRVGRSNLVAVKADNSDDGSFPPGKAQPQLDFCYFGGLYRDVFLIATDRIHITDPNEADVVAGGGVFVHTDALSGADANVGVDVHIANETAADADLRVRVSVLDEAGKVVASGESPLQAAAHTAKSVTQKIVVPGAKLWTPDTPFLHDVRVAVTDASGHAVDGYRVRTGFRTLAFDVAHGLVLNGKPYERKLIGVNRHQEFANVGFAMPDVLNWRDVKKFRDAGLTIIRGAHYPQAPSMLDACDELGSWFIVCAPGWQYWNNAPGFRAQAKRDVLEMVRRDRNHPSVIMWENGLNETPLPADYRAEVQKAVHAEYPYPGCYTVENDRGDAAKYCDILYDAPPGEGKKLRPDRVYFCREWGENVDDWNAQNFNNRVIRSSGEPAQLGQAWTYAKPDYRIGCLDMFEAAPVNFFGGTLWHGTDCNRGMHPDPLYSGILDFYRRPKYAYYLFQSQRPADVLPLASEGGPMVYVADAMTPWSPEDVTVYTNCDEVRLLANGAAAGTQKVSHTPGAIASPIVVFPKAFNYMNARHSNDSLVAEGLIGGKVVARHEVRPAMRADHIRLELDDSGLATPADGSSVVTVVASLVDKRGTVRRMAAEWVRFTVEGEGELVGDDIPSARANPKPLRWGEACALIRTSTRAGKIRVVAHCMNEGALVPKAGVLEFDSVSVARPHLESEIPPVRAGGSPAAVSASSEGPAGLRIRALEKENAELKLRAVEKQQADYGEKAARDRKEN